jgi:hypothetical protein
MNTLQPATCLLAWCNKLPLFDGIMLPSPSEWSASLLFRVLLHPGF